MNIIYLIFSILKIKLAFSRLIVNLKLINMKKIKKNFFMAVIALGVILMSSCSNDSDLNDNQGLSQKMPETHPTTRVVSIDQAKDFANKSFGAIQSKETSPQTRSLAPANSAKVEAILGENGEPVLYVVNFGDNGGFMLLSADKESSNSVIAFNTTGKLDLKETNPDSPMGLMIAEQKTIISKEIEEGIHKDAQRYGMWEYLGTTSDVTIEIELSNVGQAATTKGTHKGSWGLTQVGPWSTVSNCIWGQSNGYNADAPRPNVDLAGCPAVAVGLLCKTWNYPALYDYVNMPNSLVSSTRTSNPISRMFRDIANKIPGYSWSSTSSGAQELPILQGLRTLGYNSAKSGAYNFNTAYGNIDNWYPVLLGGFSSSTGHIWIADGYAEITWTVTRKFLGIVVDRWTEYSDNFYMNWGWYGSSNGWVDQESWPTYNGNRRMWYDLFPR
jgi:hypothetical protein